MTNTLITAMKNTQVHKGTQQHLLLQPPQTGLAPFQISLSVVAVAMGLLSLLTRLLPLLLQLGPQNLHLLSGRALHRLMLTEGVRGRESERQRQERERNAESHRDLLARYFILSIYLIRPSKLPSQCSKLPSQCSRAQDSPPSAINSAPSASSPYLPEKFL